VGFIYFMKRSILLVVLCFCELLSMSHSPLAKISQKKGKLQLPYPKHCRQPPGTQILSRHMLHVDSGRKSHCLHSPVF